MAYHTNPEVHDARSAWVDALCDPRARKAVQRLREPAVNAPEGRCCLGHACEVLGGKRTVHLGDPGYEDACAYLPKRIAQALDVMPKGDFTETHWVWRDPDGLHADTRTAPTEYEASPIDSLTRLNDDETLDPSPQEIGEFLKTHFALLRPFSDAP